MARQTRAYVIYVATNLINGKQYIGLSNSFEARRRSHMYSSLAGEVGCRLFNRALRKYGFDMFRWSIVFQTDDEQEMLDMEVRLIALWRPEYNLARGGRGVIMPRSKEWKENISRGKRGHKVTEDTRAKLSAWGKAYASTPEGIERLARLKEASLPLLMRKVICVDDNTVFSSIKAASEASGIGYGTIVGALLGKGQVYAGGKLFVYGEIPLPEPERQEILRAAKERLLGRWHGRGNRRAVVCIETGSEFVSCKAAEKELGLPAGRVYQSCADGSLVAGKYHFRHAGSAAPTPKEWTPEKRARWMAARSRPVMRLSDGMTYGSVREAAAVNGIPCPTLWKWCKAKPERGFIFIE